MVVAVACLSLQRQVARLLVVAVGGSKSTAMAAGGGQGGMGGARKKEQLAQHGHFRYRGGDSTSMMCHAGI
jgi:hypothetical protein